jgi:hypothetical protein
MGRFANAVNMDNIFTSQTPNRKVAISRYSNHSPHDVVPLRIAPAPVKKVESGGGGLSLFKRDENGKASEKGGSGTKFVEIRRKSTGEEMRVNGNGVKNDDDKVESGKDGLVEKDWQGEKDGEEMINPEDAMRDIEEFMEGVEKVRRGLRSTSVRKKYN